MNKPKTNPFLQQLVASIASKSNQGRMTDMSWGVISEAKKKKMKEGNMAPQKSKKPEYDDTSADEKPADEVGPEGAAAPKDTPPEDAEAPAAEQTPAKDVPMTPQAGDTPAESPQPEAPVDAGAEDEAEEAEGNAAKAKAELEKAKAEKDQAEKEIKKQSYVHLISSPGVHFLLGKLVDHAFKTNTIDSLASEMTGKLKIQTPDDFANFAEEMSPYKSIPGVAELLSSMKGMATKQPETDDASTGDESSHLQEQKVARLKLRSLIEGFGREKKWSVQEKKAALEAIGRYNEYGNHLRREHNLMEIASTLANIAEAAEKFTLSETDGTFDSQTVKRNMMELRKVTDQFNKLAQEAHVVQQRMEALYEDGGNILHRYFEVKDLDEGTAPAVSKLSVK